MRPQRDELSMALEGLRNRPIVAESRDYALRWERSRARVASLRVVLFGSAGLIAAACMLAYFGFALFIVKGGAEPKDLLVTRIGETRALKLSDGSRLVLDSISRAEIDFTASGRDIELLEGQAHFEVAKDSGRPFRVRTRSAEVVAVGTMFDVAATPARTTVTLIEGRVNVRSLPDSSRGESKLEVLTPGQQLDISSDGRFLGGATPVKIENVTAWQRGTIVIDDLPLPQALAVMNRYSRKRLVVLGPALQAPRVSGVFRIGDVDTETVVLERFFGLKEVARSEQEIVLGRD